MTGNLKLLVIKGEGEANVDELIWAWQQILSEYSDLVKTEKSMSIFEAWKKVEMYDTKIKICQHALDFFRADFYDDEIAQALLDNGFDFISYDGNYENWRRQLDMLESDGKTLIVFKNQAISEYNKLAPAGQTVARTEMDYEKDLAVLRKQGYKINKKKDTVLEFCAAFNAFIEEQKLLRNAKRTTI